MAALLLGGFLWAATAREVYQMTSPRSLVAHVLFRKLYAIVAFSIVGFITARLLRRFDRMRIVIASGLLVGSYSALIEIAQKFHGSTESWRWNLFDVASGVLGGLLGAIIYLAYRNH